MTDRKHYQIATPSRVLYVRLACSRRRFYAGDRADVMLGLPDMAGTWFSRARAEEVLAQARAAFPLSGLEIVEVAS